MNWIITFGVNGENATSSPVDISIPITNTTTKGGTTNLDVYVLNRSDQHIIGRYSYFDLTKGTAGRTVAEE